MSSSATLFFKDSSNKVAIEFVLLNSGKYPACLELEAMLGRRWKFQYDNKTKHTMKSARTVLFVSQIHRELF